MSYLLSDAYQQSVYSLPVSDTVYRSSLRSFGQKKKVSQAMMDTFYAASITHKSRTIRPNPRADHSARNGAYLDGSVDEKTAAEHIQSRAGLYLMEQKDSFS
ncbi:MAG: hypothetical protein ACLR8L_08100 [Oscillospiraceae bacterium]